MKKLVIIIFVFLGVPAFAQTGERVIISGNVQVPEGEDPLGITIYNLNTNRGTVTNMEGNFRIEAGLDDSLRVSSIQFQEFTVVVDEGVMDSQQLNITINEVGNPLPEIVVTPYDLTGNVTVDVLRLDVTKLPDTLTSMDVQGMYFESDAVPDDQTRVKNWALEDDHRRLVYGIRFARLFKRLLITSKMDELQRPDPDIDVKLRELYDDEFFQEYLDIELENISDFIYYADDNGLSEEMLMEGNELELIDFLVEQSKNYKRQRAGN